MNKLVAGALSIAVMLAACPAFAQQAPTSPGSAAPAAPAMPTAAAAAPGAPAVRHLVYRFGYNTKATKEGRGTGTTTIDFGGPAADGGVMVTATDDWWNTVNPRQSYTCELYPDGRVTCPQAPFALSPIQATIVPLLGKNVFAALSAGPSSSWKQTNSIRATFAPGASTGFAGQVHTWNGAYALTGKGVISGSAPLILVSLNGALKQQGGRYITANQKANLAFDPRIQIPVLLDEEITFVPTMSVNKYTVQLKLIRVSPQ